MDFVLPVTATLGFDRSEALVQGMEEWWSGRGFSLSEHNSLLNLKEELSSGHFWTTNASEPVGLKKKKKKGGVSGGGPGSWLLWGARVSPV